MGFCPDEHGIEKLNPLQSSNVFEAESKEFSTFELACGPWRSHVAIALAAMLEGKVFGDAFSDIYLLFQAVDAGI